MDRESPESVPEASRYMEALARIAPNISDLQRTLLCAHYEAVGHTASARELAKAAGAGAWQVVNSQYGQLGSLLRDALNFHADGQQSYVIASFIPPGARGNTEWLWVMHPELATALEQLGWVATNRR